VVPIALGGVLVLGGCSAGQPVAVQPPEAHGAGCHRLHDFLPGSVDGRDRRDTTPASVRTAAWGDPAVVLRCGVVRPRGLVPTSELIEVNGVGWFLAEQSTSRSRPPYVFTSTEHKTYVEVHVPGSVPRTQATAPLADLAAAIKRAMRHG
jgi:hypothetical protein